MLNQKEEQMDKLPSLLRSESTIRFQDCDPFRHLNNSKYIDYFLNAREDQVLEAYGMSIYGLAQTEGVGWVVAHNQIAYLKPANIMERVQITSKIIHFEPRWMDVEFTMDSVDGKIVKAFMWSRFVHVDVRSGQSVEHSERLMEMFGKAVQPIESNTFEERLKTIRLSRN